MDKSIAEIAEGLTNEEADFFVKSGYYQLLNLILFHGGASVAPRLRDAGLLTGLGDGVSFTKRGLAVRQRLIGG